MEARGPERGASQEIGQDAEGALFAHKPKNWVLGTLGGTDYGVDYIVTIFGDAGALPRMCYLQLKGTTQARARLADGLSLSHEFERTTLQMWHGSITPVLVAVADLIDTRDPLVASVHFEFVSPQLDAILPGLKPKQEKVTIRVPRANLITRDLDILPVIRPYIEEWRDAQKQLRENKLATGRATDSVAPLTVGGNPGLVDIASAAAEIESLIPSSDRPDDFSAALDAIRSGDAERALKLTWVPSAEERNAPSLTVGVNAYLRAKALEFYADDHEVEVLLDIAHQALPDNDDIVASIAQLRLQKIPYDEPGQSARAQLLQGLDGHEGSAVATLRAKIHALDRNFSEARNELVGLSVQKAAITKLIVSVVEADWHRVLREVEELRSLAKVTPVQAFVATIMEARALFQLGMGPSVLAKGHDLIVPAAGLPGMDIALLHKAFDAALRAMHMGQVLRWPSAIKQLLDVLSISAMVLDKMDEVIPLFAALGRSRARDAEIREPLIKFALNADHPALALQLGELAKGADGFVDEQALLAGAACRVGDVAKAFAFINDETLAKLADSEINLSTLMIIGVAADAARREELFAKIRARLDASENGRDFGAILDSAVQVRKNVLKRSEAVFQLFDYWQSNHQPAVVARHLTLNANPTDNDEAAIVCELALALQRKHSLDAEQWATFAQALITRGLYPEAISQLRVACARFESDARLASLLAVSLEFNGNAGEAFQLFERLIESGEASETARRLFINSAARIGFLDKAEAQVRSALARSTDRSIRLRHLNTLFQLALLSSTAPDQLWELAWEYGRLASPEDEREEGIFLQEAVAATFSFRPDDDDPRREEFVARRDAFLQAFPESKYLRQFELPSEPQAMLKALQEAAGVTDEQVRRGAVIQRGLDEGTIPIPFSWRPHHFLTQVPDVLAMWVLRKGMPVDRRAWHFDSVAIGISTNTPSEFAGWEPVLSLTSMLVLDECGLLDSVLQAFERIVVARESLMALQNANNPITAGYGRDVAARILATLRSHFRKIAYPPYIESPEKDIGPAWHAEEKLAMALPGRIYFCDDVLETIAVCGMEGDSRAISKPSMCTVDFLAWADASKDLFSPQEVAEKISTLIRLKIGVNVEGRYFVAAIPESLQMATSVEGAELALEEADTLRTIADGLWTPSKPYADLVTHFVDIFGYLLTHGASDGVLEALWLRWLRAVRLQTTPAMLPIDKLGSAFVRIAFGLADEGSIRRLWSVFWKVLETGLPDEVEGSADRTGVIVIARALGAVLAAGISEHGATIADVSLKVRAGLGAGTQLDELYGRNYVEAAAERARKPE
jgi:hypothetical protein